MSKSIEDISDISLKTAINLVMPNVFNVNEAVRWRAVEVGGRLIAKLAESDLESAKIFIRRLIWTLTEESGGCPYGSPELMGEALANSSVLADTYASILISYLIPDGNFLEHEPLQAGVIWGIGRLAEKFPELCQDAPQYLCEMMKSEDAKVRGLACWTLSKTSADASVCSERIKVLQQDNTEIIIYTDHPTKVVKIASLAQKLSG